MAEAETKATCHLSVRARHTGSLPGAAVLTRQEELLAFGQVNPTPDLSMAHGLSHRAGRGSLGTRVGWASRGWQRVGAQLIEAIGGQKGPLYPGVEVEVRVDGLPPT